MSRGTLDTASSSKFLSTGLSPSLVGLPRTFRLTLWSHVAVHNPNVLGTLVWAFSFSLAATQKIDFSFSSCGYLDVSVPRVPPAWLCIHHAVTELFSARFPHSDISGSLAICASPKLFAAYHVLHRLLVPRHSPYALKNLTKYFTT